ncbi:TIGR00366 family protein [Cytophagales bacterium LB-30]|uniref:TIGR00366 family protein n=1 Tax=Shiella aurantiaca TaxID=3058365 RepID=A0ABT8F1Y6_9BACT|nr:TIGR00366 family protein [Shiella aurantiaca]MDN4164261.1 TIGR00366 family protein [Shiella aurantiaca]
MDKNSKFLKIPSPFVLAFLLTLLTLAMALAFSPVESGGNRIITMLNFWQMGFWELLEFTGQMVLILLFGHTLALSPVVDRLINRLVRYCTSTSISVVVVCVSTLLVAFVNWGMCLVFGAILARKIGENASRNNIPINYPLIGASAYTGMMLWHGGLSGSAPLAVSQANHFMKDVIGQIPLSDTLFSSMNISLLLTSLVVVPLFAWLLSKLYKEKDFINGPGIMSDFVPHHEPEESSSLDTSAWPARTLGLMILVVGAISLWNSQQGLGFLNLNYINFILFGLCITLHKNLYAFQKAIGEAISGTSGILIQFPLYAGIMGIMKYSGLAQQIAEGFISMSSVRDLPLLSFASASLINIFIPSGGGQWAIQGPIICKAALSLGTPIPKVIMAFAYGDQLTNMLQPFWALPLLAITKLRVREILPYTLLFMVLGGLLFTLFLLLF